MGGLADVSAARPKEVARLGHQARMLSAEATRSRWLTEHRTDLTRALSHAP